MRTEHGPLGDSFDDFVARATGYEPYPYQRRIAAEGLPELLKAPTGAGKTLAATLPWLYRRRLHPDPAVRSATPHWLVLVLPMRVLVEQTRDVIAGWLNKAWLSDDVTLHVVMGGEGRLESLWRRFPERDAIFVGTQDMLISRALNRGYAASRFVWPIDFGLFNAGCQWVLDEVQLMGPSLPTSRQLQGLRGKLGTAIPCASMWMSATVDEGKLSTIDLPSIDSIVELADEDRSGPLARRLEAAKVVRRLSLEEDAKRYTRSLADQLLEHHRPGTLTVAMLNTVERARELWTEIRKTGHADLVLVHSRFRPPDRAARLGEALAEVDPAGPGRIVVSTQVLEAGVDISATTLLTEAAPWPSIVQRAGRCNRDGESADALLLWSSPPTAAPYEPEDVDAAASALVDLEGVPMTPPQLGARGVNIKEVVHPVLRRVDLIGLFDTTPDLSGNDLDVGRFIREAQDLDVQVAWRSIPEMGPSKNEPTPIRNELCPVPIAQMRDALRRKKGEEARRGWRFDHLEAAWVRCGLDDLRPGHVVILRAEQGGYDPLAGWNPKSELPVEALVTEDPAPLAESAEATEDDPITFAPGAWVTLCDHLAEAETALGELTEGFAPTGLSSAHLDAAARAARLHDLGKVHPKFQEFLLRSVRDPREAAPGEGPWAKSGGSGRPRHVRRYFRHELVSALALLRDPAPLDGCAEPDLALFLVAAHHGRVRVGIRSLPDETRPENDSNRRVAMGIWDGETLPAVEFPGGRFGPVALDLSPMELGDTPSGAWSWTERVLALRDRRDLGPFRLAFLEALVRLSDWRVSADAGRSIS